MFPLFTEQSVHTKCTYPDRLKPATIGTTTTTITTTTTTTRRLPVPRMVKLRSFPPPPLALDAIGLPVPLYELDAFQ